LFDIKKFLSFGLVVALTTVGCKKDQPSPSGPDEPTTQPSAATRPATRPPTAATKPAPKPKPRPAPKVVKVDGPFEKALKQVLALEADTKFFEAKGLCEEMQETFASHPKVAGLTKVISRLRQQRLHAGRLPQAIRDLTSPQRLIVKLAVKKLTSAGPVGRIFLRKALRVNPDKKIATKAGKVLVGLRDEGTVRAALTRLAADRAANRDMVSALLVSVTDKALLDERIAPKQVDPELPPAIYRLTSDAGGEIKWQLVRALGLLLRRGYAGDTKTFENAVRTPGAYRSLIVMTTNGLLSKDPDVVGWACDLAEYFTPLVPGLHGKYFADKTFKKLATELLDATASRDAARTFPFPDNRQDDISVRWTGYLRITKPGGHVFAMHADDKAWLFINDKLVLTREGWGESKVTVKLDPGLHKFRVDYMQIRLNSGIRLTWTEPNRPQTTQTTNLPVVTKPWRRLVLKMDPALDNLVAAKRDQSRAARATLVAAGELGRIYLRDALVTKPDNVAEKALQMLVSQRDKPTAAILISLLAKKPDSPIAGALTDALRTLADLIEPDQYAVLYRRVKYSPAEMTPQAAALCGVLETVCDANADKFNALVGDPTAHAGLKAHVAKALTSKDAAAATRASRFGAPFAPRMRGLRGQYFYGWQFDQRVMQRLDTRIYITNRQFPMPKNQQDDIAARWTGMVAAAADGNYTFYLQATPSARLWLDGKQVLLARNWVLAQYVVKLTRGLHRLKIDYANPTGSDQIQLDWSGPGFKKRVMTGSELRTSPWPGELANIAEAVKKLASEKPGELLAARAKLRHTWPASGVQLRNVIRYKGGKVFVESARFLTDQRDQKTPPVLIARLRAAPAPAPEVADAIATGLVAMVDKIDPARFPQFLKSVKADAARAMIPQASVLCRALDSLCANDAKKFGKLAGDPAAYDALKSYVAAALIAKDSTTVVRACRFGRPFAPLRTGLRARYYEGRHFDRLVLQRYDTRVFIANRQFPHKTRQDFVSARWTGLLNIDKPGKYTFFLRAHDRAELLIDGRRVTEALAWVEKSGVVHLPAGLHHFRVDFHQASTSGGTRVQVAWTGPDIKTKQAIPGNVFYSPSWRENLTPLPLAVRDLASETIKTRHAAINTLTRAGDVGRVFLRNALRHGPDKIIPRALDLLMDRPDKKVPPLLIARLAKPADPRLTAVLTMALRSMATLIDQAQCVALWQSVRKDKTAAMMPQAGVLCAILETVCDGDAAKFNNLVNDPKAHDALTAYVRKALTSKDATTVARACALAAPIAPRFSGLRGEYFLEPYRDQLVLQRPDAGVQIENRKFPMPGGRQDRISSRWTGMLMIPADGEYKFQLWGEASARLWIDGKLIAHSKAYTVAPVAVRLTRGPHPIRVQQTQITGNCRVQLYWSQPGAASALLTGPAIRTPSWSAESANILAAVAKLGSKKPPDIQAARTKLYRTWPVSGVYLRNAMRHDNPPAADEIVRILTDFRDDQTAEVLAERLQAGAPAAMLPAITAGLTGLVDTIDPARFPQFLKAVKADAKRTMIPQASVLCAALVRISVSDATKFNRLVKDPAGYAALKAYVRAALTSKDTASVIRACRYGYPFAPLLAGLRARYYDGFNRDLLVRERIDWKVNFTSGQFPHPAGRQTNVSATWTGLLNVDKPGKYTFFARGETRMQVHLDDRLVVEATAWGETPGAVDIAPGLHQLRVNYRHIQGVGTTRAEVSWSGPEIAKQPLPGGAFRTAAWPALLKRIVDAVGKLASAKPPEALAARTAVEDAQPVATIFLRNALRYAADGVAAQAAIILARDHDAESAGLVAWRFLRAKTPADVRAFANATAELARWLTREHAGALYRTFNPRGATPNLSAAILAAVLDRACGGDKARFNALADDAKAYDRLRSYFHWKMTDKDPAVVAWACEHGGPFAPPAKGLWGSYYLGRNFDTLKAGGYAASVVVANRSFTRLCSRDDNISARWTGKVIVAKPGKYTFHMTADDGARVWVDDRLVADAWISSAGKEVQGVVQLAAGTHTLDVNYYQTTGNSGITLSWSGAGIAKQVIPQAALRTAPPVAELAKLTAVIKALGATGAAQVAAAKKRLIAVGEPAIVLLRNTLRYDTTASVGGAAVVLDKLGDKQAAPLLMARLKRQPGSPAAPHICRALARIPTSLSPPAASWVHWHVKADTNFKATHYADLLLAIYQKACKGAAVTFNTLVADPKGLDALKAYVTKAAASKNAPIVTWATSKFPILKIVKKP